MATTYYNAIQSLYVAYFNRPADPAGLAYWEGRVEAANGSTAAVSAEFAASAEYKSLYANMTNEQIVDTVYKNLFGRPAEAEGKKYWADLMTAGTITVDAVVRDVSNAALGSDKTAFNNKVTAAVAFTNALDTPAEQAGYTADSISLAKDYIAGVTTDSTLATATNAGNLNSTIAEVVAKGTPFTLTGTLASYDAAQKAVFNFLDAADGTVDNTVDEAATRTKIDTAVTTAETKVGGMITGGTYVGASAGVQSALLADQVAKNNDALIKAQVGVTEATSDIAKVAGLSSAIATWEAATTASDAADATLKSANADLAAKLAAYDSLNGKVVGTTTVDATTGEVTGLIVLKDGKLALATDVTETTNPGVTALLGSSTAQLAAESAAGKADTAETSAKSMVDYLDMSAAEKTQLETIGGLMKNVKVADGAVPTLAQITTEQSILDAKANAAGAPQADIDAAANFKLAVKAYTDIAGTNNLYDALDAANGVVDAKEKAITDLTKALSDLNKAEVTADTLKGLDAVVTATEGAFTAHDLALPVTATGSMLASAGSDIFLAGKTDASISLFGLLGNDALFVGKDYVLNTGKLSTGDNAKLEVFATQDGDNTLLQIEQHAFSSGITTPGAEIVKITLVGVTATDVHLDNGIITVGGTHA